MMISGGGRLAGIGGVYKYSCVDSTNFDGLVWQYPYAALLIYVKRIYRKKEYCYSYIIGVGGCIGPRVVR